MNSGQKSGLNYTFREGHCEGVELSEALNSAKGFLFGLRKTLGDGMKKVKPKVTPSTIKVFQISTKYPD